jgi:hypothetical protein
MDPHIFQIFIVTIVSLLYIKAKCCSFIKTRQLVKNSLEVKGIGLFMRPYTYDTGIKIRHQTRSLEVAVHLNKHCVFRG